jgi:hypothetical protein
MGAYNEAVETGVVNAIEALTGLAGTITYPGTAPVYTNLPDAFIDAAASVRKHRNGNASAVLLGIGADAYLMKQKDGQGRPLVTTGDYGPTNARRRQSRGVRPDRRRGHRPVRDHQFGGQREPHVRRQGRRPAPAGIRHVPFRYEEVLGPSAVRLGVWGYAAPVVNRYPTALANLEAGSPYPGPSRRSDPF